MERNWQFIFGNWGHTMIEITDRAAAELKSLFDKEGIAHVITSYSIHYTKLYEQ